MRVSPRGRVASRNPPEEGTATPASPRRAEAKPALDHALTTDDEQERRVTLLLLGKELSWCTGSSIRSPLEWTRGSSRVRAPPMASRAIAMREK